MKKKPGLDIAMILSIAVTVAFGGLMLIPITNVRIDTETAEVSLQASAATAG